MDDEENQILVIAGDICPFRYMTKDSEVITWFLAQMDKRFNEIVWVPGNHEFYGQNINAVTNEPGGGCYNDFQIISATLWSDFDSGNPLSMLTCKRRINDFRKIMKNEHDETITPKDVIAIHNDHRQFINEKLNTKEYKKIVVTHHAPSYQSIDDVYKGSDVNGAFVSSMDEIVALADIWIHDHTHNTKDYMIGDCRVICNAYGYHWEDTGFDPFLVVEI